MTMAMTKKSDAQRNYNCEPVPSIGVMSVLHTTQYRVNPYNPPYYPNIFLYELTIKLKETDSLKILLV